MEHPKMRLRFPSTWYFHLPPSPNPAVLPAVTEGRSFACPFNIDPVVYTAALDYRFPLTFMAIYAVTVLALSRYNVSNSNKPWRISQTRAFKTFVVAHNIGLAVFSALTCVGLLRALAHTWPGEHELTVFGKTWPGLRTTNTFAGAADALCHMHGPRGFGDAVYFDSNTGAWNSKNLLIKLRGAEPDPSDVGRLWNEGLAFWGFWFYISKFYEVVDTFIILAKGKRSTTLQTYHHAGAMMCMWAGIRFMSPPIWMFVFINSGIHVLMYIFYTISGLGRQVPQKFKRAITTLQILQFLIGMSYAILHLFVEYTVPISVPYQVAHTITSVMAEATESVASAVSEASQAVATAGILAMLKKIALRAAGEEGLAENVQDKYGKPFGVGAPIVQELREHVRHDTRYRTEYATMRCLDTQGQVFAIYLNLLYLLPLTGLFVRFFVRSYLNRSSSDNQTTRKRRLSRSLQDAAHGIRREMDAANDATGKGTNGSVKKDPASAGKTESAPSTPSKKSKNKNKNKNKDLSSSVGDVANTIKQSAQDTLEAGKEALQNATNSASGKNTGNTPTKGQMSQGKDTPRRKNDKSFAGEESGVLVEKVESAASTAAEKVKSAASSTAELAKETAQEGKSVADDVQKKAQHAADEAAALLDDEADNTGNDSPSRRNRKKNKNGNGNGSRIPRASRSPVKKAEGGDAATHVSAKEIREGKAPTYATAAVEGEEEVKVGEVVDMHGEE